MLGPILVGVDRDRGSDRALLEAVEWAAHGARLRLVHALVAGPRDPDRAAARRRAGEAALARAAGMARRGGVVAETALLPDRGRSLADELADEAIRSGADLIVLRTHRDPGGPGTVGLGAAVAAAAPVPVLLARTSVVRW